MSVCQELSNLVGGLSCLFMTGVAIKLYSDWCDKREARRREKLTPKATMKVTDLSMIKVKDL